jgi:hypothetical protein
MRWWLVVTVLAAGCGAAMAQEVALGSQSAIQVGRSATAPQPQLIRLTVTDPTGHEQPELQQTVWVSAEPVATTVPFAMNDAKGDWTLTATGVITGQSVAAKVAVR